MDRLLLPEDRVSFKPFNDGRGISRGLKLCWKKLPSPGHPGSGLISYSFGTAKYQNRRSRKWTAFNYDRRHALTLWYSYELGKRWQASLLWRYASGLPYTDILGVRLRDAPGARSEWDYVRGPRNGDRLPAYQRLDARLSYYLYSENRRVVFYLDLINLYNYSNVYNLWEKSRRRGWIAL
jgi:hypothetical protein